MGIILDKPATEKDIISFNEGAFSGVMVSMQGWRRSMEDAYKAAPSVEFDKNTGFFAVFDGHGGEKTAKYCADNLLPFLEKKIRDSTFTSVPTTDQLDEIIKKGFVEFDNQIMEENLERSGSTAITGFITPESFIVSNLGDSRCLLCCNGEAIPLSTDHKPNNKEEKDRITNAGGLVFNNRVNGDLALSRAFGDFAYKRRDDLQPDAQEVSCVPDVVVRRRSLDDNFVVFACDGIWDVFTDPAEFVDEVTRLLKSFATAREAMSALLDICLERRSMDNMTILIVLLDKAPLPDPVMMKAMQEKIEADRKEKEDSENRMIISGTNGVAKV